MIMDNERPVRISNFEICEITAVSGCYRLCCSDGGSCGSRGGNWVVSSRFTFGVIHCSAPMMLSAGLPCFAADTEERNDAYPVAGQVDLDSLAGRGRVGFLCPATAWDLALDGPEGHEIV